MTLHRFLIPLLVFGGISFAQDRGNSTNFPLGPQYLVTSGNPMFLRPIATPSLSLGTGTLAGTSEVPVATQPSAFAPPETILFLNGVFWGEHPPSQVFDRRIETPSLTADQTQWYMHAVANNMPVPTAPFPETVEVAALENSEVPAANVIELTGGPMPTNLPLSILETGVTGVTDPQSLEQRGYGVSLGETAAYWKTHKRQAPRVLTNQDLRRD